MIFDNVLILKQGTDFPKDYPFSSADHISVPSRSMFNANLVILVDRNNTVANIRKNRDSMTGNISLSNNSGIISYRGRDLLFYSYEKFAILEDVAIFAYKQYNHSFMSQPIISLNPMMQRYDSSGLCEYRVGNIYPSITRKSERVDWINSNLKGKWEIRDEILYFEEKRDLVKYRLMWGG